MFERRATRALCATMAAAVVTAGVAVYPAGASDHRSGGATDAKLRWDLVPGSSSIAAGTPHCDPLAASQCVVPFTNASRWVGDVEGHQTQAGAVVRLGDNSLESTATSWVTGTVKGCAGSGTFAVAWRTTNHPNGTGNGTASVIVGSGTGGLAGLDGAFSFTITVDAQGRPNTAYSGKLRCRT